MSDPPCTTLLLLWLVAPTAAAAPDVPLTSVSACDLSVTRKKQTRTWTRTSRTWHQALSGEGVLTPDFLSRIPTGRSGATEPPVRFVVVPTPVLSSEGVWAVDFCAHLGDPGERVAPPCVRVGPGETLPLRWEAPGLTVSCELYWE